MSDVTANQDVAVLRKRLLQLCDAFLRINENLDFDSVLQKVLDSARSLTGAEFGMIVLVTEEQETAEFLSSGMTPEQANELWELPDKWEFFECLSGIEEPLRLEDFQSFLKDHGLSVLRSLFQMSPATAYLGAPIRFQGQRVGVISIAEKKGGFSAEDEETLVIFASQAAQVISNTRQYRQEQRARADLEALMNTVPMAVLVINAKTGELRSVNREVRRLLGDFSLTSESLHELVSTGTCHRADGPVISQQVDSLQQVVIAGETIRNEEVAIEFSNGQGFVAIVNGTPIHAADGSVESVIVTAQDMAPLAEKERLYTDFVGMVGHELRSPLNAIKGSTAALLGYQSALDPAEMIEYYRIIDEQADCMRELISSLSDMVRIESGMLSVSPVPLELAGLVDEARNIFLNSGGREHIRIDISCDLPLVLADRRRIIQVIINLLANASRNSNEKSTISLDAWAQDVHVAISVADNGRGIPAERMPHLFAKYSQQDGPDQSLNLGLGLAICKGIVEAHGGRIWAESDGPGLGSRFIFTVPASDESTSSVALKRTKAAARPHRAVSSDLTRILAVDDDPRTLKRIRDLLAEEGYEPVVTGDPDEVVSLIQEADPQVVLLDLMLPGKDGIDLMKDILAIRGMPVIFLSGYDQDELVIKAFEMGAVDYIVKPFSSTELVARVRAALRKKPERPSSFELGDLTINFTERSVTVAGQLVELAPTEFRLLAELSAKAGMAMGHDLLFQKVWGTDQPGNARRVYTVVKNLRQKLGDDARNPRYIVTVPRVGYRMPKAMQ